MTYDSFVRDRLPPPQLLPEFRFDLPELHYPERLNDVQAQFTAFERALGVGAPLIAQWRSNPAGLNPYASAQIYFYYGGAAPYRYRGIPPGLKLLSDLAAHIWHRSRRVFPGRTGTTPATSPT